MKKLVLIQLVLFAFVKTLFSQTPSIEINPFQQMANPTNYTIDGVMYKSVDNIFVFGSEQNATTLNSGYFMKDDWEHWHLLVDSNIYVGGKSPAQGQNTSGTTPISGAYEYAAPYIPIDSKGNIYYPTLNGNYGVYKYNINNAHLKYIDSSNNGLLRWWYNPDGNILINELDQLIFTQGSGVRFTVADTNLNVIYDTIYNSAFVPGSSWSSTASTLLPSKNHTWFVSDSLLFLYSNYHLKYIETYTHNFNSFLVDANGYLNFQPLLATNESGELVAAMTTRGQNSSNFNKDTIKIYITDGQTSRLLQFKDSVLSFAFVECLNPHFGFGYSNLQFYCNRDGSYTFFIYDFNNHKTLFHTVSSTGQFIDDVTLEDISPQLTCYMDMCLVTKDGLLAWNSSTDPTLTCHNNKGNFPMVLYNRVGVKKFSGRVYYDLNHNATYDAGDFPASQNLIHQNIEGYNALSYSDGKYFLSFLDSSKTYTINCTPTNSNYTFTTPSSYTVCPSINSCQNIDFGISIPSNFNDLSIRISHTENRPGYQVLYWLNYKNKLASAVGDSITFLFDDSLSFVSSSIIPSTISGHRLTWNINHLTPFSDSVIKCVFMVAQHIPLHDSLTCIAKIFPLQNDQDSMDNISKPFIETHAPFDPNFKEVEPVGNTDPDSILTYTIHFQNTGNDTAFNVVLIDTLDANLNYSSFQIITSSSPVIAEIKDSSFLYFKFYNILLPDSGHSQLNSHGFVQYSIKPKHLFNTTYNTISNTASIYFDFNSPIKTNTIEKIICHNPVSTTLNANICFGSSYFFNNQNITVAGIYHDTLYNYVGCDSIISLYLNVFSPNITTINKTICYDDTLQFNNHQYFTTGVYHDTLQDHFGCDSVIVTNLIVSPKVSFSFVLNVTPYPLLEYDSMWHIWKIWCNDTCIISLNKKFTSYLWSNGSTQDTVRQFFPNFHYESFIAIVTDSNGCKAQDSVNIQSMCEGMNDLSASQNSMTVTPNPCSTCEVILKTTVATYDLQIKDIIGRKIEAQFEKTAQGYNIILPNNLSGLFFIHNVQTNETIKFVKE